MRKPVIERWLKARKKKILSFPEYDSFGTVVMLKSNLYGVLTKSPIYSSDAWVYLLLGEKNALVIDTGFGIGDLKSVLQTLAGELPLVVFNTHFHIDHSLGNSQFDQIYIHELDAPMLFPMSFTEYSRWSGRPVIAHGFYKEEDVIPYHPYEAIPVKNHWTIDIGGNLLEAFHIPGHTCGGMMLLDRKDRILFTGDAILYPFPAPLAYAFHTDPDHMDLMRVSAFAKGLEAFAPYLNEFDAIYDGHGVPGAPGIVVEDMILCANDVVSHPNEDYTPITMARGNARMKCWGSASITYTPERI